jgi:hypothetical protein
MISLTNYQDFIDQVDELGFLPMSGLAPGLPSLGDLTPGSSWHTGDPDTDPWQWKDRAAQEKKLAYGCILNGQKGFVSRNLYAAFYTALHPPQPMPVRWSEGLVDRTTWLLWNLFEKQGVLSTFEAHRMLASPSSGSSRIDRCLQSLQAAYYITGAGNARKVSHSGQEYGWPAMRYQRVLDWAPESWLVEARGMGVQEAWEIILEAGQAISAAAGTHLDRKDLARALGRKESGD